MRVYFLSDQHLKEPNEERCQALLLFFNSLQSTEDCEHIFLLGDVFDLWIGEHKYFIDKWFEFNSALLRLKNLGIQVHVFEGNHDLYMEPYFRHQLGFRVHTEPIHLELGGRLFRIEHGDQMDPSDRGYLFLRWFLRTAFMKFVALRFPSGFVKGLGEWASRQSRHYTSEVKTTDRERTRKVIEAHALKSQGQQDFDILVCGHVHQKEDFVLTTGNGKKFRVLNLGFQEDPLKVEL